jgi:hypothetical protein
MLLAALLLVACQSENDIVTPTDDAEVVVGTETRPPVEAVDSATVDTGSTGDTHVPTGDTQLVFEFECGDELDDDNDGLIDCADPDCLATPDCSAETCDDRIDNEGDGLVDCLDPDCVADPSCDTSCADLVLTDPVPFQVTGSTSGQGNDINPGCATSSASDVAFAFVAPVNGNYTFTTAGSSYDTVLYLISGCSGREVACNDDAGGTLQSSVNATMSAGQTVIVIVDGYSSSQGSFRLNVSN